MFLPLGGECALALLLTKYQKLAVSRDGEGGACQNHWRRRRNREKKSSCPYPSLRLRNSTPTNSIPMTNSGPEPPFQPAPPPTHGDGCRPTSWHVTGDRNEVKTGGPSSRSFVIRQECPGIKLHPGNHWPLRLTAYSAAGHIGCRVTLTRLTIYHTTGISIHCPEYSDAFSVSHLRHFNQYGLYK